ncbi:DUF1304 domain-containing protein [Permianibacter sp. IMCC34836]|uniref:DUF1304 domain-containing protein n=1 Tax=Permianibacter fluminis TaxID=2738515 RepID=UPI0015551CFF|nr:DUF1304 domain-containing protein [Permianibacter fluminis]NQD37371.1 DUF1304 domain-containing protein [Permianibacter fluminis]
MMTLVIVLVLFIAIQHLGFLVLEMFFWDHPVGRKIFRQTPEQSASSKVLAANQGLYNGFLAAGLVFGLFFAGQPTLVFFLGCVLVAGIYGGLTAKRSILFVQGLPAAITLLVLYFA